MVRVNLEVGEGTREEWKREVEESDVYSSVTHLIKLAVHRELNDERSSRGGGGGDVHVDTSGIEDEVGHMRAEIQSLRDTVEDLELREQSGDMDDERRNDLTMRGVNYMPSIPRDFSLEDYLEQNPPSTPTGTVATTDSDSNGGGDGASGVVETGLVEDIANVMGEPHMDVRIALSRAERDVPHVHSERINGTRRYYKDE